MESLDLVSLRKRGFLFLRHLILLIIILCQKLQHYGIRDTALTWIKSYLEDQTQFVQFGSHRSYPRKILCGVLQGSILRPLLLLFTSMIFLMSLVSLNLYCLLMTQVSFVPIKMPTTSFLLLTMNLQK